MKRVLLIFVGGAMLIADSIIWPAVSGRIGGFGIILFLIGLILTFGMHRWVVGWGLGISFVAELLLGLYFGSLMGTWLIICWAWYLASRFLSMKPLQETDSWFGIIPLALCGIALYVIAEIGEWLLVRRAYENNLPSTLLKSLLTNPAMFAGMSIELILLLLVLRSVYAPKFSIYA